MKLQFGFGAYPKPLTFLLGALLCAIAPASAQQRTQADSLRADSLRQDSLRRARGDTLRVVSDSVKPPPILVKHAAPFTADFGGSVREWTRDELLLSSALTLGELLEELPSVAAIRTGLFLQPEASVPLGQTRGALQVVLDGYELDPLSEATVDISRIELANLNHVRVERRLDVTRIELSSLEPTEGRPHSRIDAGVGEPNINLFRGVFLTPKFLLGPLGFTLERIDTDGLHRREPADVFAGWAKWALIRGRTGIQFELRQSTLNRSTGSPWLGDSKRQDLIVRARAPIAGGLVGELFAGRSKFQNDTTSTQTTDNDSTRIPRMESAVVQYGGRASFESPVFRADGSVRFRNHDLLPPVQIDGSAALRVPGFATFAAEVSHADWGNAGSALAYDLRAQTDDFQGLFGFAEIAGGKRGAPSAYFRSVDSALVSERKGLRAGLGIERWGARASGAFLKVQMDSMQGFGLPFDTTDVVFGGSDLTGWEATWSVPLLLKEFRAVGSYTNWLDGTFSVYQPTQLWRAALELHALPLKSKNLELYGWIELRHRGEMLAPTLSQDSTGWQTVPLHAHDIINGYLQIRIMDIRLFIRGENLANKALEEIPGRIVQTPRYLYGIKWTFTN